MEGNIDRKLYYSKDIIKSVVLGKYFFNRSNTKNMEQADFDKIKLTLRNNKQLPFIKMLFSDFKDILYQCYTENSGVINRKVVKIEIEKKSNTIFNLKYN
jgi:hypothetical protein